MNEVSLYLKLYNVEQDHVFRIFEKYAHKDCADNLEIFKIFTNGTEN